MDWIAAKRQARINSLRYSLIFQSSSHISLKYLKCLLRRRPELAKSKSTVCLTIHANFPGFGSQ